MTIRRSSFPDIVPPSADSASGAPALRITQVAKRLIARLLTRVIEMRMQQAQGRVNVYLRSLDDRQLASLGLKSSEIGIIRRSKSSTAPGV
jgi:hypothetical protein